MPCTLNFVTAVQYWKPFGYVFIARELKQLLQPALRHVTEDQMRQRHELISSMFYIQVCARWAINAP
jgi:hypothetical protein